MIRALEVYDSFDHRRLLEVRFVIMEESGMHYDWKAHSKVIHPDMKENPDQPRYLGCTLTGKSFRSSYHSLRELMMKPGEMTQRSEGEKIMEGNAVEERVAA
jgi:hypothetical protein